MKFGLEKFQYFLLGRKFVVITDHKALETLRLKKDFGSKNVQRWIDEISMYDFDVKYVQGADLIQADSLSRSIGSCDNLTKVILEVYENSGHRKGIRALILEQRGVEVTENCLKKALAKCISCAKKDKSRHKSAKFVVTSHPREIVAADLMDIRKTKKVISGIDYFSRKLFGKVLSSKESKPVLEFIKDCYKYLPFKILQTDEVKEFENVQTREWCETVGVTHKVVTPNYHQGNGRLERANRMVREALKRSKGTLPNG